MFEAARQILSKLNLDIFLDNRWRFLSKFDLLIYANVSDLVCVYIYIYI